MESDGTYEKDESSQEPALDTNIISREEKYVQLLINALHISAQYQPKFGQGKRGAISLAEFQTLYGADPFYHWVGIDSPLMYAAHKAAGGMTSIYRQLGIGGEWVFRAVLQDSLGLTREQVSWSYQVPTPNGKPKTLTLDARIVFEDVKDLPLRNRIETWVNEVKSRLLLPAEKKYNGMVFEVRQGYKSMDSKRQNADIDNATSAYIYDYLPVLLVLSKQIDAVLVQRYSGARLPILIGTADGSPLQSTYAFCRDIIGYDLARFFEIYSTRIKMKIEQVLKDLLGV